MSVYPAWIAIGVKGHVDIEWLGGKKHVVMVLYIAITLMMILSSSMPSSIKNAMLIVRAMNSCESVVLMLACELVPLTKVACRGLQYSHPGNWVPRQWICGAVYRTRRTISAYLIASSDLPTLQAGGSDQDGSHPEV